MTAALSPRGREIVDAARGLLDASADGGPSMRQIADRVGIRAASLYKHFPDKAALEAALISDGFAEWTARFERAQTGSGDPVGAFAGAYRGFALDNPSLYRLMTERELARDRLTPGIEERAAAPALALAGGDEDRARALWAFAHGMAILELNHRFPPGADVGAAWGRGLEALATVPGR